jgi:hypothetical protein
MHFKRLRPSELLGLLGGAMLAVSLFLFPWFTLTDVPQRTADEFLCGREVFECAGWEVFPIARWLLLIGAISPLVLLWVVLRNHSLSWPPGQMSMVIGIVVATLVAYNGLVATPGGPTAYGVGLMWGYYVALAGSLLIVVAAALRSLREGGGAPRRPPGQF